MYKLLVFACWLTAVQGGGGGGPIRSYAFSYASPDGGASRFERSHLGSVSGGYKYRTPEGALVAVRYSNDPLVRSDDSYVQHLEGQAYRRLGGQRAHESPAVAAVRALPAQSYAFSYATPDGQSRYESNEDGGAVKGGYQYTAPDGTVVKVRYVADEHGFRTLDDGFIDHGPKAGSDRRAYSYSFNTLPLTRPALQVKSQAQVAVTHVQRPLPYFYAPPATGYHAPPATGYYAPPAYYVRDVDDDDHDDDDDDRDDDLDDDDRKLVYFHGLPFAFHAPQRQALPVTYAAQKNYNTARVAQVPLVNYGYVISH